MFDFLKRWVSPARPPAPGKRRSSAGKSQRTRSKGPNPSAPLPLSVPAPEVIEGNEETDWALWEDSVSVLDSRAAPLSPRDSVYDRLAPSSQFNDVDAFGSVRKRDK